jgi:hypothetical protein
MCVALTGGNLTTIGSCHGGDKEGTERKRREKKLLDICHAVYYVKSSLNKEPDYLLVPLPRKNQCATGFGQAPKILL